MSARSIAVKLACRRQRAGGRVIAALKLPEFLNLAVALRPRSWSSSAAAETRYDSLSSSNQPKNSGAVANSSSVINIKSLNELEERVAQAKAPLLIDFWAPWCAPCKQFTPVLTNVVQKQGRGIIKLAMVNVDELPDVAEQLQIASLPTLLAVQRGRVVGKWAGALASNQIVEIVKKLIQVSIQESGGSKELDCGTNNEGDDAEADLRDLKQGELKEQEDNYSEAKQLYLDIANRADEEFQAESEALKQKENESNAINVAGLRQRRRSLRRTSFGAIALARASRCDMKLGNFDEAVATLARLKRDYVESQRDAEQEVTQIIFWVEIEQELKSFSPRDIAAVLEDTTRTDDTDPQPSFILALFALNKNDVETAYSLLSNLVKSHRSWREKAAMRVLLRLFNVLGPKHPITIKGRRQLANLVL